MATTRKAEDYLYPVRTDGFNTDKAVTLGSTLTSTGNQSTAGVQVSKSGSAATAGGAEALRVGTGATGVVGVYYGSGVPTIAAPKGSLYLRTDGSSTSTRAYINTDASTTWTAITTAA
jgi:hypothetical protein